jgi:hypothetical protein
MNGTSPTPFFAWSILEAWGWLIHVPFLGFLFLLMLGGLVGLIALIVLTARS